jgi:hypothetical protein
MVAMMRSPPKNRFQCELASQFFALSRERLWLEELFFWMEVLRLDDDANALQAPNDV